MCTQIGGAQLGAAVLMHGPLETVLPNTEIIHLCFWSRLNQIQEPWSWQFWIWCHIKDRLTQATFLGWVIHKHIHFYTAGQVSNMSYLRFQTIHLQWKWFLGTVFSSATWANVLCVCSFMFVEEDVVQSQFHRSLYLDKGAIDLPPWVSHRYMDSVFSGQDMPQLHL